MTLGLRPGEVSGLTWPSIYVDDGYVVVRQALAWDGNRPYLKETKTKTTRTLDLPGRTVDALTAHRKRSIEERLLNLLLPTSPTQAQASANLSYADRDARRRGKRVASQLGDQTRAGNKLQKPVAATTGPADPSATTSTTYG